MLKLIKICIVCIFCCHIVFQIVEGFSMENNNIQIHIVKYAMEEVESGYLSNYQARIYPFVKYVGFLEIDGNLNMKYKFLDEKEGLGIYNKFEEAKKNGFKGYMQWIIKPESIPSDGVLSKRGDNKIYWYWSGIVTKDEKYFIPIFLQNVLFDKGYSVIDASVGEKYLKLKASKEIEKKELLNATILTRGEAIYQRNYKIVKSSNSIIERPQKNKKKYSAHIVRFKLEDINDYICNDMENYQKVHGNENYLGKVVIKNNDELICDFELKNYERNEMLEFFEQAKKSGIKAEKYYYEKPESYPKTGELTYLEDEKLWYWKGIATVEDDDFAELFIKNAGYPYLQYRTFENKHKKGKIASNFEKLNWIYLEPNEKIYAKDYIVIKRDEEGIKAIKAYMDKVVAEKIAERREEMANILRQQGHSDEEINRYFQKEK